jgi:hypothetical protein
MKEMLTVIVPAASTAAHTETHYHINFPSDMDRWTDKQRWDFWINLGTTLSVAGSRSSPAVGSISLVS